jgi:hypothetical protein
MSKAFGRIPWSNRLGRIFIIIWMRSICNFMLVRGDSGEVGMHVLEQLRLSSVHPTLGGGGLAWFQRGGQNLKPRYKYAVLRRPFGHV